MPCGLQSRANCSPVVVVVPADATTTPSISWE
jgi:hypothetical protein